MPIQQMNISLSPQMARFIRGKVKKGEYTNISEVVRDAVRHLQEAEAAKTEAKWLAHFEDFLSKSAREGIRQRVRQGLKDMEGGRYEEFDATGLRELATTLVQASVKKAAARRAR